MISPPSNQECQRAPRSSLSPFYAREAEPSGAAEIAVGRGAPAVFFHCLRMIVPVKVEAHDARAFPRAIESKLAKLARRSHLSHATLRALKKLSVRGDDVVL